MSTKSIKLNAILNVIRNVLGVIFPLITFPYVSRVLGVDNMGKVNFTASIISYFTLIASLGITNYAIREGAAIRNKKDELSRFSSEVFTINICSTIISYLLLAILLCVSLKLKDYRTLLIIQSVIVVFKTVGVSWTNNIFEDFLYITVRTLLVQILSISLMFIFVKSIDDYIVYAIILVLSQIGAEVSNYIYARKRINIKLVLHPNLKRHMKPILILFCTSITTMIYVNSDSTMIGYLNSDYNVGIYGVAVKIYGIVKNVYTSILVVVLPRLSFYLAEKNMDKYSETLKKIFQFMWILLLPITTGLYLQSDNIVHIISGDSYSEAAIALRILCFALFFSGLATFISYTVIIPMKMEKYFLRGSIVSAIINVSLNFIMIPRLQQNGAAITTAISECIVLIMLFWPARKFFKKTICERTLVPSIVGCFSIIIICLCIRKITSNFLVNIIFSVVTSSFIYYITLVLFKNPIAIEILHKISTIFNKLRSKL